MHKNKELHGIKEQEKVIEKSAKIGTGAAEEKDKCPLHTEQTRDWGNGLHPAVRGLTSPSDGPMA